MIFSVDEGFTVAHNIQQIGGNYGVRSEHWSRNEMEEGIEWKPGGRPKSRLLSEALRTRLAEVKPDDPQKPTWAEVVATNLIEIACLEGPGAVHAASEIADRLEGRSRQAIEFADITADLRNRSDEELRFSESAHERFVLWK